MLRLATVDLGAWVLPLVGLRLVAAASRRLGDRFVHYVVASNWGSALIVWMMLPSALIGFSSRRADDFRRSCRWCCSLLSMVLTWRMTNAAIGRGAAIGTAVFAGMFVARCCLFGLQMLLRRLQVHAFGAFARTLDSGAVG